MCLLNRLVTIISLWFCLEKEGLTDRLGGEKSESHLCEVKEVLTGSMRRKEIRVIRAVGNDRRGKEKGRERRRETKLGGRMTKRS